MATAKEKPPEKETVELVGTSAQKTDKHEVWSAGKLLVEFTNGVATVEHDVAEELRKLGLVK